LPVVVYGCETWSYTPRLEHSLRMFENRVLRRIFGPKRGEVAGDWRRLHHEELQNLSWAGSMHGRDEKCTQNFGQKTEVQRPLGKPRHKWEDIRLYLREIGWEGV